jgi:hypothetical protein
MYSRQPPPDDRQVPDRRGSRSPGPPDGWSTPEHSDRVRGGYAGRRPAGPAGGQGVAARYPDDLPGRTVGQHGYLIRPLPPQPAAPPQARAPDPSYTAYWGTAVPERPGLAGAGITGNADDTSPLPVVLDTGPLSPEPFQDDPGWSPGGPPAQHPASAQPPAPVPFQVREPVPAPGQEEPASWPGIGSRADDTARPEQAAAAQAKLEQIKDLYMTAEAIGEDALVRHFDELKQRQRSLIREYFEQTGLTPPRSPAAPGDDQPLGGGSLPG